MIFRDDSNLKVFVAAIFFTIIISFPNDMDTNLYIDIV